MTGSKYRDDEEINFDSYFNQNKQPQEEKKTKTSAPIIPQSKSTSNSKEQNRSYDIQTPSTSLSVKTDNTPNSSVTLPAKKQNATTSDDSDGSVDEDVDELLGKLEVSISGKYTHTYIHITFPLFNLLLFLFAFHK
jgi:hypothetical protein